MHPRKPLVLCVLASLLVSGIVLVVQLRRSPVPVATALPPPQASPSGIVLPDEPDQVPPAVAAPTAPPDPQPRAVKPLELPRSMEEFTAQQRAIRQELPHLSPRDYSRLRHFCPADFNRDDTVDEADLAAYMERWQAGDGVTAYLADINRDEVLDSLDVNEFLSAYFNNDCDPQQQKTARATAPPDRVRRIARREGGTLRVFDDPQRSSLAR